MLKEEKVKRHLLCCQYVLSCIMSHLHTKTVYLLLFLWAEGQSFFQICIHCYFSILFLTIYCSFTGPLYLSVLSHVFLTHGREISSLSVCMNCLCHAPLFYIHFSYTTRFAFDATENRTVKISIGVQFNTVIMPRKKKLSNTIKKCIHCHFHSVNGLTTMSTLSDVVRGNLWQDISGGRRRHIVEAFFVNYKCPCCDLKDWEPQTKQTR